MDNIFKRACWIWGKNTDGVNIYCAFKKIFDLADIPEAPELYISVDSGCLVYINGNLIQLSQYPDYPHYKVYERVQIPTEYFNKGNNIIAVLGYCQNEDSSTYLKGQPRLIFRLCDGDALLAQSDEKVMCCDTTGFTCGSIEKCSFQLSYSFRFDANEEKNWYADFDYGEEWYPAHTVCGVQVYPRPIKPLVVGEKLTGKITAQGVFISDKSADTSGKRIESAFLKHKVFNGLAVGERAVPSADGIKFDSGLEGDGIYVLIDLQKESVGYLSLDLEVGERCSIDIGYGEHTEDLRVRSAPCGRNFACTYTCKPGRNKFSYRLKRIGCRYIQLHVSAPQFTLYYCGILPVDYPVGQKRETPRLNLLRQKIYDVSVATLRSCMHDHYEDCPWREQALYAMDSRNQMLCGYECFGEYDFPKASIRLLALGKRADGFLELCAPSRQSAMIPGFCLMWIVELSEYLTARSDAEFANEMLPTVNSVLDKMRGYYEGGLLRCPNEDPGYWNFYEWTEYMDGVNAAGNAYETRQGHDAPLNAYFALALLHSQNIYKTVGDNERAENVKAEYGELKSKFNAVFWDEIKKGYRLNDRPEFSNVYPELLQALSVCAGLCDSREREISVADNIKEQKYYPLTSLSHSVFKYDALITADRNNKDFVLDDIEKKWSKMLFSGATTFWETEKGSEDFNDSGSLCHGWSAIPVYFFHKLIN